MEYLPGGDLKHRIRAGITVEQALDYLETIAGALHAAHLKHIVHRDVKPANVLFRADGTLVLSDFGIAKRLGSDDITLSGSTIGSPHYLSPEQARGRPVDARADIYSLGIMLYEMLTGRKPYRGASDIDTVLMHVNEPPPRLPAHLGELQTLIDHTTAKDPVERYPEAATAIAALRQARAAWRRRQQQRLSPAPPQQDADEPHTITLDLSFHSAATRPNPAAFHEADTLPEQPDASRAGHTDTRGTASGQLTRQASGAGVHAADTRDAEPAGSRAERTDARTTASSEVPPPASDAGFHEADTLAAEPDAAGARPADADTGAGRAPAPSRRLPIALASGGLLALALGAALLLNHASPPRPASTERVASGPAADTPGDTTAAAAEAPAAARADVADDAGMAAPAAPAAVTADRGTPASIGRPAEPGAPIAAQADPADDAGTVAPAAPVAAIAAGPGSAPVADKPVDATAAGTGPPASPAAPTDLAGDADRVAAGAAGPQGAAAGGDAPREGEAERIDRLLADAERALEEFRLTRPAGDNAWEYAREAQALDPDEPRAQAVIDGLVQRYVALAKSSVAAEDWGRARTYVARGLAVEPADEELLALEGRVAQRLRTADIGSTADAGGMADAGATPAAAATREAERDTTPMGVKGETPRELLERIRGFFD